MNRSTKSLLVALGLSYGGFAVANLVLAYYTSTARTGRMPGQNKLLDFNDSLLRVNLLARLIGDQGAGPALPGIPVSPAASTFPALAPAQVTDTAGGTTTYYG